VEYNIVLTPKAKEMLAGIDRGSRRAITARIDELKTEPTKRGKALAGALKGYRTLRAVAQRYRIIYKVEDATVTVLVVTIGIRREGDRKDIYELTQRLHRVGLLLADAASVEQEGGNT